MIEHRGLDGGLGVDARIDQDDPLLDDARVGGASIEQDVGLHVEDFEAARLGEPGDLRFLDREAALTRGMPAQGPDRVVGDPRRNLDGPLPVDDDGDATGRHGIVGDDPAKNGVPEISVEVEPHSSPLTRDIARRAPALDLRSDRPNLGRPAPRLRPGEPIAHFGGRCSDARDGPCGAHGGTASSFRPGVGLHGRRAEAIGRTSPGPIAPVRARSSAGEHYLDMVGVTGSIPVAPTNYLSDVSGLFLMRDARRFLISVSTNLSCVQTSNLLGSMNHG